MKTFMIKVDNLIDPLRIAAHKFASPVLDLGFRLYVADVFFKSGMGRFKSFLNGDWSTQVFLFGEEHPVPGLAPSFAATVTTAAELILPILLAFGLFTRFSALGLFIMTLVIQLTYLQNTEHVLWMALMAVIIIKGPGTISLDHVLIKWLRKDKTS